MKILKLIALQLLVVIIGACGGGGGVDSSAPSVVSPSTGVLLDSPVAGMDYKTDTLSGKTNAKGEFSYLPGQVVTFSVGSIKLPPVVAGSVVTPIEIANSADINNRVVGNILVLLQSLDEDGNPENGISIPAGASFKAINAIDLDISEADFAKHPKLLELLATVGLGTRAIVPSDIAREHFQRTQVKSLGADPLDLTPDTNAGIVSERVNICGYDVGKNVINGVVTSVHDGDTVTVNSNGTLYKVRLDTIDAPELAQPFGPQSQAALSTILLGKSVAIRYTKRDKYGRIVGTVFTDTCTNANLRQVSSGMAWFYKAYQCEVNLGLRNEFANAQSAAVGSMVGLWSQVNPIAPWFFRNGVDPKTPACGSDSAVVASISSGVSIPVLPPVVTSPSVTTTPTITTPVTGVIETNAPTGCRKIWVNGYTKSNGTHVDGYWRNSPGCA